MSHFQWYHLSPPSSPPLLPLSLPPLPSSLPPPPSSLPPLLPPSLPPSLPPAVSGHQTMDVLVRRPSPVQYSPETAHTIEISREEDENGEFGSFGFTLLYEKPPVVGTIVPGTVSVQSLWIKMDWHAIRKLSQTSAV